MGPQHRLGICVGFDSPSIIRYLEPSTSDVFKARFDDCHFDEIVFSKLGREKSLLEARREITWNALTLSHLDPCINQCELEVQRIIYLQSIANQLPDVFTHSKKIVKSHISTTNTLTRIEVPIGQSINIVANVSKPRLKHGRPLGLKIKSLEREKCKKSKSLLLKKLYP